MSDSAPPGALITAAAAALLGRLQDQHGPVMFHQLIIDVVPGRGGGFSLEAPEGLRFVSRGKVFSDAEKELLRDVQVITGAAYERGERPSSRGHIVEFDDKTPLPGTCPTPQR
ncbi:MAG: uncharacterized protein QOD58_188 [Mycobacterium sp.]|jgi:hypothetical protein|nr:uncharacterized protein [Mycobacterium sp.]